MSEDQQAGDGGGVGGQGVGANVKEAVVRVAQALEDGLEAPGQGAAVAAGETGDLGDGAAAAEHGLDQGAVGDGQVPRQFEQGIDAQAAGAGGGGGGGIQVLGVEARGHGVFPGQAGLE